MANILDLQDSILGSIYWKDLNGIYRGCNEYAAKMAGLKDEASLIGKTDYDIFPKEVADGFRANDLEVIKTGKPRVVEEKVIMPDGRVLIQLSSKKPLRDGEGNICGVIGNTVDITYLKNIEEELIKAKELAEAASKLKTEFVQNMQHDIRTPSSGLWGVLDFLAKTEPDSDRKEALIMALTASKRLLDLCNDAVEFGDLSGNHRPQLEKPFDLREVAKSVVELNLPAAFSKDLLFHFKVDSTVPAHIISDEFRISRILINLLGNAIKFCPEGEVTLKIKARLDKDDNRHGVLIIEIRDTGIGIAKDKINNIFDKFSRAVASNTNKYPGTGLGLYVVKTFIDELDGDIEVESHENEGAYFKLSVPFKILWEDIKKPGIEIDEHFTSTIRKAIESERDKKIKDGKSSSEKTPFAHDILIIEDDKICLFAEKNLLSGFTNKIDSAENVAEALEKLSKKRYDLVISDLGLPDGSGNDIVAKVKSSPESLNYKTPFVAMTAHQDAEKHKQAMDAGFAATNTKPLSTDKAVELLKTYPSGGAEIESEEEGLAVIDIPLGMQRIRANEDGAIEALRILLKTLQEDIPMLQEAEKNNNIKGAREVLHKIRGGLCYSGTPRLEKAFAVLHDEVKRTSELSKIDYLFSVAYDEAKLFAEGFKKLIHS